MTLPEKAMIQSLEAIKGGGGSIKVGATGKIRALMSRELESGKSSSPSSSSSGNDSSSLPSSNGKDHKATQVARKKKHSENTRRIPTLDNGDELVVDRAPKPVKKGSSLVEVVDIKCGTPDAIRHRLKKFGLSKLSENIV